MMGIYIKGMKMPASCMDCPFKGLDRAGGRVNICTINDSITLRAVFDGADFVKFIRIGDCPLIPVPPHGKLIDADGLHKEALKLSETKNGYYNCLDPVISCYTIDCAPTIIPAEPPKEEWISADLDTIIDCYSNQVEEVYGQYTDTAGNFHWTGTHSGEHKVKTEEGE